jgi:DNA-binding response OmpR family regulator
MPHTGSGSSLQKKVLQIQVAANGKQVIAQVRNFHPDLLLLQVSLPDIDGREVCRQLRRDPRTLLLPIVMVSEKDDIQDAILGLDAGADDYLRLAQYSPGEVIERIRAVLAREAKILDQKIKIVD